MEPRPWWSPEIHRQRRPYLAARGRIRSGIRSWFEGQGFTETECGALVVSPGNETHLHAFRTAYLAENGQAVPLYLHTSPEFALKKLLAAGETRIFDFASAYRNSETGPRHLPEFTMLEWYRTGAALDDMIQDCRQIACIAADAAGTGQLSYRGLACDPFAPPEVLSVSEAFRQYADIELETCLGDTQALREAVVRAGIGVPDEASWTDLFSAVLVTRIEPRLGVERLTFLCHYPISEAALARPLPEDDRFADRFEMYACATELANGYNELTDAALTRKRQEAEMDLRQSIYADRHPLDPDFISAVGAMPQASGTALGFDRLVMLACGAADICQVRWTPPPLPAGMFSA